MKSRNDFLTLTEYKFYLHSYYFGIALNGYMVGPDFKNVTSVNQILFSSNVLAKKMVDEVFSNTDYVNNKKSKTDSNDK